MTYDKECVAASRRIGERGGSYLNYRAHNAAALLHCWLLPVAARACSHTSPAPSSALQCSAKRELLLLLLLQQQQQKQDQPQQQRPPPRLHAAWLGNLGLLASAGRRMIRRPVAFPGDGMERDTRCHRDAAVLCSRHCISLIVIQGLRLNDPCCFAVWLLPLLTWSEPVASSVAGQQMQHESMQQPVAHTQVHSVAT